MSVSGKASNAKQAVQNVTDPGLQVALNAIIELILEVGKTVEDIESNMKRNR